MVKRKNNLQKFHDEGEKYLNEYISSMDIWKRQEFFLNCIKIIDKTFLDSISTADHEAGRFFGNILHFAVPVLIDYLYTDEFVNLPAAVLARLTDESLKECRTFLSACQLVGWSAYLLNLEQLKIIKTRSFFNWCKIGFLQKNHRIELIESKFIHYYEELLCYQLEKRPQYKESINRRESIIERMRTLCYVWNEHFIGYNGDQEVEDYFRDLAHIDSLHDTEWDMYSDDAIFGSLPYASFVDSVVDLSGYAIKHLYFVRLLKEKHPELITENLFYLILTQENLLHLIKENGDISDQQAESVLKCLSLDSDSKGLYNDTQAFCAPLIRISKHQYIHSCAGSLYHPFSFLLENLTKIYPDDCNKNRKKREDVFRAQLYNILFDYHCIDHQMIISKKGQHITDIDAAAVDTRTGEIALFQLKWQDHTSLSPKTLLSKSKNYVNSVSKWIEKMLQWIESSSETEIANLLGISPKLVDKTKIYLFAIGREHGNYSGTAPNTPKCVWVQWYHFCNYIFRNGRNDISISDMHSDLMDESPYKISLDYKSKIYKYGKYRFVF